MMFETPIRDQRQLAEMLTPPFAPIPRDNLQPIAEGMLKLAIQAHGRDASDLKVQRVALCALFELGIEDAEATLLEEVVNEAFQGMKAFAERSEEVAA